MFTLNTFIQAKNRMHQSGSYMLDTFRAKLTAMRYKRVWATFMISFLLVGSCHQSGAGSASAATIQRNLAQLSKSDMMRYAYILQAAVAENPDLLTRIDERKVRLILASPDLLRKDGQTQSWQYRAGSCVLDVFMTDDAAQVAHYEFRSTDALNEEEPGKWQCLQALYQTRRAQIEKSFEEIYVEAQHGNAG